MSKYARSDWKKRRRQQRNGLQHQQLGLYETVFLYTSRSQTCKLQLEAGINTRGAAERPTQSDGLTFSKAPPTFQQLHYSVVSPERNKIKKHTKNLTRRTRSFTVKEKPTERRAEIKHAVPKTNKKTTLVALFRHFLCFCVYECLSSSY